jgi:hypothetical protein
LIYLNAFTTEWWTEAADTKIIRDPYSTPTGIEAQNDLDAVTGNLKHFVSITW